MRDLIRTLVARHVLLVVDSCFAGAMLRDAYMPRPRSREDLPSRQCMASSAPDEKASDGPVGRNSPFAEAFATCLERPQGNTLSIAAIYDHIAGVFEAQRQPQIPLFRPLDDTGDQLGAFVLHSRMASTPQQPPTPPQQPWRSPLVEGLRHQAAGHALGGRYAEAIALYQKALAISPQDEGCKAELKHCQDEFEAELERERKAAIARAEAQRRAEQARQAEEAARTAPRVVVKVRSEEFVLVRVEGTFTMGDVMGDKEHATEFPLHEVSLSDYYMAETPTTQAVWQALMGSNPSYFKGKDLPVENVSWYDAVAFCNALSKLLELGEAYVVENVKLDGDGRIVNATVAPVAGAKGFRLPTEAEWEYAARERGRKVPFGNGKDVADPGEMNFNGSEAYKKPYSVVGEYQGRTTPVMQFPPSALGLRDMSGNVWEWCSDWFKGYPGSSGVSDYTGQRTVLRGGSWGNHPLRCRVAFRDHCAPAYRVNFIGLRPTRTP